MPSFSSKKRLEALLESPSRTRRLIYGLFLLIVFTSVVANIWLYIRGRDAELANSLLRRESAAEFSALLLEERFDHLSDTAISLSTRVQFRRHIEAGDWDAAGQILKDVPKDFPFVEKVFLADGGGTLMADIPRSDLIGQNFSQRDWYAGVEKGGGKAYVSEAYRRSTVPQINVITVAAPILSDDGRRLGVLGIQVGLRTLFDWSKDVFMGHEAEIFFLDQHGHIAVGGAATDGDIRNAADVPPLDLALKEAQSTSIIFDPSSNEEKIVSRSGVAGYGWIIVVVQPTRVALKTFHDDVRWNLLFQALLGLFLTACLSILLVIFRRISLYRQRETAYLRNAGDGIACIDKDWNIVLWNPAAVVLTGWQAEEAVGRPMREVLKFVRERDRSENILFISDAMLSREARTMEERTILIGKDGRETPVGDSASPIIDENGKVAGAVIIFRDASRERETLSIKSSFAYAYHQLRTPVTQAIWNVEMALEECEDPALKEKIRIAYFSMLSVKKLVSELTEISEIDQGMLIAASDEVQAIEVVDAVVPGVIEKAAARHVKVAVETASGAWMLSDKKMLIRIFSEILDNAVAYGTPGSTITMKTSSVDRTVLFEVRDHGIGIPQEQQGIIFTKFFRGLNIPPESVGAGLGLFICSSYTKLLGGKIWFRSKETEGTSFFVQIPIDRNRPLA